MWLSGTIERCAWAVLLLSATGCAYASRISGPGGREAFRIHCADHPQCVDKAGEVCSNDFEILSSKTVMDGYANNGTGYAMTPHEIVVACRSPSQPRAPAPSPAPALAPGPAPALAPGPAPALAPSAEPRVEPGACAAAHASVSETATFWAQLYPEAKRLEEAPSQRDFVEVCRALPERVQRCLDARYREVHGKPCLAVLRRLEPGEKNRIDSLFLE